MCSVCLKSPCHPACPNAPEPKPVTVCCECKDGIFAGDLYFTDADGKDHCLVCLEDKSPGELLELVGEKLVEAKEDE